MVFTPVLLRCTTPLSLQPLWFGPRQWTIERGEGGYILLLSSRGKHFQVLCLPVQHEKVSAIHFLWSPSLLQTVDYARFSDKGAWQSAVPLKVLAGQ